MRACVAEIAAMRIMPWCCRQQPIVHTGVVKGLAAESIGIDWFRDYRDDDRAQQLVLSS
jgi:hypothetical protein